MKAARGLSVLLIGMAIVACTQQSPQVVKPVATLRTVELPFGEAAAGLRPQTSTVRPDSVVSFDLSPLPSNVVGNDGAFQYISRTFTFTNTGNVPLTNLTLYAYNQASNNAGGTAIKSLVNFNSTNVNTAQNAQLLLPTHGMSGNGTVTVDAGREDLQVISEAEASAVQSQARPTNLNVIGANDTVLEYGFVARSLANGGRTIDAAGCATTDCNRGKITIGYKTPAGNVNAGYSFTATFVLATEFDTRVTRSPDETDAGAIARAPSGSQMVVLGGASSSYTSSLIVPLANAKISTTPALLLEPSCGTGTVTPIYSIQGTGSSAALTGVQTVEGVVVGDFQSNGTTGLQGFYIQDRFGDGNTATSDAIFVDESNTNPDSTVSVGDYVRVSGTVAESNSLTEIEPTSAANVQVCGTRTLPVPTKVTFPLPNGQADLEKYEGMLVQIPTELTVTELFQLGQFGQVTLASGGLNNEAGTDNRLDQYTQFNAPSVSGYVTYVSDNNKRAIVLDDGRSDSNPPVNVLGRGGNPLTASNTLRGGDTITDLTGVIDYRFSLYRIQPTAPANFLATNVRPTSPSVSGTLRVASFNVLNFFTTINSTPNTFTDSCAVTNTSRGANTALEFTRQKAKIAQAILAINPDVLGVIEMQNNGSTAINDLVAALNATAGAGVYTSASAPANGYSCDAIKVDFIYKPAVVALSAIASPDASYTSFSSVRKPVAATFTQLSNGAVFTAVMNHFKSKSSAAPGTGNADISDGQGASNALRVQNATDLKNWLATNPTGTTDPDYLLMGDFNAYAKEDPLATLETAGYTNLNPATSYSYVFDGAWGSLDHAFGSSSLLSQVDGATKFHNNADEPTALDYNIQLDTGAPIKTTTQIGTLYAADPYRASDHDPVVVGLNLTGPSSGFNIVATTLSSTSFVSGTGGTANSTITINRNNFPDPVLLSLEVSPANAGITATFISNPNSNGTSTMNLSVASNVAAGSYSLTIKGTGNSIVSTNNTLNIIVNPVCTGLTISPTSATVAVGSTIALSATLTPSGCIPNGSLTWSSIDSSKASVSPSGVVTGVAVTSTPVTISASAGTLNSSNTSAITVTPQPISCTSYSQNWSSVTLSNDNWSGVNGVKGYRGDGLASAAGVDPQTILGEGTLVLDVNVGTTAPNGLTTGGVTYFTTPNVTDPTIALAGSGTARAPYIQIEMSTTSCTNLITVAYRLRDLESGADNAVQPIALQYRVGTSGNFINIPSAYTPDATTGSNTQGPDIPVSVNLPAAALGQATVQLRIMTADAVGSDEWVGIDDIGITGN